MDTEFEKERTDITKSQDDNDELPILTLEVHKAVCSLKDSKAAGIDNILSEVIQKGISKMARNSHENIQYNLEGKIWPAK